MRYLILLFCMALAFASNAQLLPVFKPKEKTEAKKPAVKPPVKSKVASKPVKRKVTNGDVENFPWDYAYYTGTIKNSKPDGYGKLCRNPGSQVGYEGYWVDGKQTGTGTQYYYWGETIEYTGEFNEGRFHGHGKWYPYKHSTLKYHEGEFWDGGYVSGTSYFLNGDVYKGPADYFNRKAVKGAYTFSNGDSYSGEFTGCKMNGAGYYYWKATNTGRMEYQGFFKDNAMEGEGRLFFPVSGQKQTKLYYGFFKKLSETNTSFKDKATEKFSNFTGVILQKPIEF